MLDSIFSPGQVYSQSRVFSENVSVIMVENGGRKWKRGFLAWFISWKLFSENIENKCVCVCFQRFPLTNYQSDGCGSTLLLSYIYNYQSDVHVTYYWDDFEERNQLVVRVDPMGDWSKFCTSRNACSCLSVFYWAWL